MSNKELTWRTIEILVPRTVNVGIEFDEEGMGTVREVREQMIQLDITPSMVHESLDHTGDWELIDARPDPSLVREDTLEEKS